MGEQQEAAVTLKDTRSAGNRQVSRSWADVEDSSTNVNCNKASLALHVLRAGVEAQVTCKASEVDEGDAVAVAIGGTRTRRGRRPKATKGAMATRCVEPTFRVREMEAKAKWLEKQLMIVDKELLILDKKLMGSGG